MVYKSKYCCYQYLKNCADLTEVFIGDTNVITEIIFSDYYRTFLLCILSIGVVFFMRNASIRKKTFKIFGTKEISRIRIYCIFTFSLDIYCMHNFYWIWLWINNSYCAMGIKVDTLFYNKYNIAVCNVLFFLEKK